MTKIESFICWRCGHTISNHNTFGIGHKEPAAIRFQKHLNVCNITEWFGNGTRSRRKQTNQATP